MDSEDALKAEADREAAKQQLILELADMGITYDDTLGELSEDRKLLRCLRPVDKFVFLPPFFFGSHYENGAALSFPSATANDQGYARLPEGVGWQAASHRV